MLEKHKTQPRLESIDGHNEENANDPSLFIWTIVIAQVEVNLQDKKVLRKMVFMSTRNERNRLLLKEEEEEFKKSNKIVNDHCRCINRKLISLHYLYIFSTYYCTLYLAILQCLGNIDVTSITTQKT